MTPDELQVAIVAVAAEKWQREPGGSTSLNIAAELGVDHEVVFAAIERLVADGRGSANRTMLYHMGLYTEDGGKTWNEQDDQAGTDAFIYFPSEADLTALFTARGEEFGPFKNRIMQRPEQITHYYFDAEVLEKYRRHPEKYSLDDDVVSGHIALNDDYYEKQPKEVEDRDQVGFLRYGRRRLAAGGWALAAMIIDLSRMSKQEQHYWLGFEIVNPVFAKRDEHATKYFQQSFEGAFVDHDDPLERIGQNIERINGVLGRKFFRRGGAIHFIAPTVNTRAAYCEAHKELFKILGADVLDRNLLCEVLKSRCGMKNVDFHVNGDEAAKQIGSWGLFEKLIVRAGGVFMPFAACAEARKEDAHRVVSVEPAKDHWVERFRKECELIGRELGRLVAFLSEETDLG